MSDRLVRYLLSSALVISTAALSGCYTQLGTTESEDSGYSSTEEYVVPDSLEDVQPGDTGEDYESARYRFYFGVGYPYVGYPYVGFGISYGYYDPWYYWPAYSWYGSPYWYYGAYWPGYWYPPPGGWCCGTYPDYYPYSTAYVSTRTFGTTRYSGSTRSGYGAYRTGDRASSRDVTPVYRTGSVSTRTGSTRTGTAVRTDRTATSQGRGTTGTRSTVSTGRRSTTGRYYTPPAELQTRRLPGSDQVSPRGERRGRSEASTSGSAGQSTRRSGSDSGSRQGSYSAPARSSPPPASRGSSPSGGGSSSHAGSTRGSRR